MSDDAAVFADSLPIYLTADKAVITYISMLTKTEARMVLVNLRDMSNKAIERLKSRITPKNNTHRYHTHASTWTNITYPDTDVTFRVTIDQTYNHHLKSRHQEERRAVFLSEGNPIQLVFPEPPKGKKKKKKADRDWNATNYREARAHEDAWHKANPGPYKDYDYTCIMAVFKYTPNNSSFVISQEEIDTILIEEILFAPSQTEEEDDGDQTTEH
jgi:hypothetical protein